MFLSALLVAGCAQKKKATFPDDAYAPRTVPVGPSNSDSITNRNMIVTLDAASFGKVASVNPADKFVVLNFPLGHMPTNDQRLSLYRRGLKVGEVKVTGPRQDDNTVADLLTGDAQEGDEVRNQ